MVDFLVRHKLLNPSQHGILKASSCFTNMFFKEITEWTDEGSPVYIMHLYFHKCKAHGIKDGTIDMIEQWLTEQIYALIELVGQK